MSWHYLQEQEGGLLVAKESDLIQFVPLKLTNTQETFYFPDKKTDLCQDSQYGTMLKHLTGNNGPEK